MHSQVNDFSTAMPWSREIQPHGTRHYFVKWNRCGGIAPLTHDDAEWSPGAMPPRIVHLHAQPNQLACWHHRLPVDIDDRRDRPIGDPAVDARLGEGKEARRTPARDGSAGR